MAGSLDVDKRPVVNSGGILYPSTAMNSNKSSGHEPPDVFCGLGSVIVEGRVPRKEVGKDGHGVHHEEGPHALKHFGPSGSINRGHVCCSNNYMCKKDENFRKHMLLLWQNNVPVSIEVLLCSDCRVGRQKANSVEYSTIPEPGSILLEQWTVSISNNLMRKDSKPGTARNPFPASSVEQNSITAKGLFQAVRSYLHFSQLSAWYDSFRGSAPSCILYRITIPGETFASKFSCQPEQHYFPPAAVGSMALVNVAVRSYPRTDKIPKVLCTHNITELRSHSPTTVSSSSTGDILPSDSSSPAVSPVCASSSHIPDRVSDSNSTSPMTVQEENKLAVAGALSWRETERIETDLRKMALVKNKMTECTLSNSNIGITTLPRSDSMDSMLGDSLLDPPQDLQKIPPKRYQSPSRCGSPSIETPEHLLFRRHYNSIENTSSLSQLYKNNGTDAKYAESAKNRLARQDLLRRRDIGQTFGIPGPCHGLHPRMLLNVGQHQPRLSLPPKHTSTIASPAIITNGPYRAFPPERGMHQFTYMDRTSCNQNDLTQYCGVDDINRLSQNFENMQVKCNISGKHMCNMEPKHDCFDMNKNSEMPCDKELQALDTNVTGKNTEKELAREQVNAYCSISRPLKEYDPSFVLGGAKKKSTIPISRVYKKNDAFCNMTSKRKQYKNIESDDDTGMEVAEYDISDINSKIPNKSIAKEFESTTEQFDERHVTFQKEVNDILDGLTPKKAICTSRRSSLKDEDQLFPHQCRCSKGRNQTPIDPFNLGSTKTPELKVSSLTQVYRSETETPIALSPLLQLKSLKKDGRANSPVQALNKADILLGAILRTCERNKHLESEKDLTTESSISSREDSYSMGAVRKSPEERKNSAGDADDEEGNTSSDNGSSILSSPSSSDEEETQLHLKKGADISWFKPRYNRVSNKAKLKKKKNVGNEKKSDSSSSQCSPCNLLPSINTSSILPSKDDSPSNNYVKTQIICDNKEEKSHPIETISHICSTKENRLSEKLGTEDPVFLLDLGRLASENKITKCDTSISSHTSSTKSHRGPKNILQDSFNNDAISKNIDYLQGEYAAERDFGKCHRSEYDESDLEDDQADISFNNTQSSDTKVLSMSENLHEYSSSIPHDRMLHRSIHKIFPDIHRVESLNKDGWFDEDYSNDYTRSSSNRYENQVLKELQSRSNNSDSDAHNTTLCKDELANSATSISNGISIPTMVQKDNFRKTLNSATSMVFHRNTGLPLSSSPAPLRKGANDFGYDSSINTPNAIKRALYPTSSTRSRCSSTLNSNNGAAKLELNSSDKEDRSHEMEDAGTEIENDESDEISSQKHKIAKKRHDTFTNDYEHINKRHRSSKSSKVLSVSAPASVSSHGSTPSNLLGTFEESVLNGRLEPVSTVEGFSAEIGASGSFHPKHKTVPVNVFFYNMCCDNSPSISSPYLGHINLGKKGYRVPQSGTIQATLFNPLGTVIKMFVVMYDLSDMPPNSQTFIRQRTFYMPTTDTIHDNDIRKVDKNQDGAYPVGASPKWLRYLIHLRFASSKSGKIYLHTDIRMIIFRKSDLDTATDHNITPGKLGGFELRSFTNGPTNPKFSPRKINFRQEE